MPWFGLMDDAQTSEHEMLKTDVPTWRTIRVGTYSSLERLLVAIDESGCRVAYHLCRCGTHDVFLSSEMRDGFAKSVRMIDLVVLSVAELGFPKGATDKMMESRSFQLGLKRCTPEVGMQLRLQYADQSEGEELYIAMEPITTGFGVDGILRLENRKGVKRLDFCEKDSGATYEPDTRFVFVKSHAPVAP